MIVESLARARREDKREDEHLAHVADLYGCDRATWYRRRGFEKPELSDAKFRKFDLGHAYEHQVAARLIEAGHRVETGVEVAVWIDAGGTLQGCRREYVDEHAFGPEGGEYVVGHTDIIVDDVPIDTKTTDKRKVDAIVADHYALQIATYTFALGFPMGLIVAQHVATWDKDEIEYPVFVSEWRDRIEDRVFEVLDRTGPDSVELPPPEPPVESRDWACGYCDFRAQCELDGGPMPGAKVKK